MTEKDKIELMRRFEPFGREIPKDQVMEVIARVPTESSESEKHQLSEEIPTNTPTKSTNISTKSTNISTNPSADRPKGEWVNEEGVYGAAYCSECNYELRVNNTNFCPNCGADMRGGEDK